MDTRYNATNATFVSVWDGGYEVSTRCWADLASRTFWNIEAAEPYDDEGDELEHLDYEYIVMDDDDTRYPVVEESEFDARNFEKNAIVFTY